MSSLNRAGVRLWLQPRHGGEQQLTMTFEVPTINSSTCLGSRNEVTKADSVFTKTDACDRTEKWAVVTERLEHGARGKVGIKV